MAEDGEESKPHHHLTSRKNGAYLSRQLTSSSQQSSVVWHKRRSNLLFQKSRQGAEYGEEEDYRGDLSNKYLSNVKQNSSDISSGNGNNTNKSVPHTVVFGASRNTSDKLKMATPDMRSKRQS